MKRDYIALLLQPYKNSLLAKAELQRAINGLSDYLIGLAHRYPHLKFNIALPGYLLECIDPLKLSTLRDILKRGNIEWLCTGYTEPFLSFSPHWLTKENIKLGLHTFKELTGEKPAGYTPPFSNWEPSQIDLFRNAGLKYAVISNELLTQPERDSCGYWITEHTGFSIAMFPARSYHRHNAPENLVKWIEETFPDREFCESSSRMYILRYLISLDPRVDQSQHYKWIDQIAAEADKRILQFQPTRFRDILGSTPPLGLQYVPSSLVLSNNEPASPYFLNHLHCHDQIGILQRKLMEACDDIQNLKETKQISRLKQQLFLIQDINRFLPSESAGFSNLNDRLWTYGKLINIERELHGLNKTKGGMIQLTDFLRNGYKSIIMANRSLKLYLDHKRGAQVYELDYRDRCYNACAAYNPRVRSRPDVITNGESLLSFVDRIFPEPVSCSDFRSGLFEDSSSFPQEPFDYTFKKSSAGVKLVLNCQGGFSKGSHTLPLSMEKIFGLEGESAVLSFGYQLNNNSLTPYSFIFAVELALALPGSLEDKAILKCNKKTYDSVGKEPITLQKATTWEIEDSITGVKMQFVTQKQADVWVVPSDPPRTETSTPNGITLLISSPVNINESSSWSFVGKLKFRKTRVKGSQDDLI
ncbi:MAG: alpha-amylase/4-alpha-glucanotransferase domain-containing protein [Chitinispirillaceae bacterium]